MTNCKKIKYEVYSNEDTPDRLFSLDEDGCLTLDAVLPDEKSDYDAYYIPYTITVTKGHSKKRSKP